MERPLERQLPFPQAAPAWLICEINGRLIVKFSAPALFAVMVAGMAYPWWLGSAGGSVDGDDLGFWVAAHVHVLCSTVKNLPSSRLNSMAAGGWPLVSAWAISCSSAVP